MFLAILASCNSAELTSGNVKWRATKLDSNNSTIEILHLAYGYKPGDTIIRASSKLVLIDSVRTLH